MTSLSSTAPGCPSGLSPAAARDTKAGFSGFVRDTGDEHTIDLVVRGAKCGGCLSKIEKSVSTLQGVTQARLNLSSGAMRVRWTGPLSADRIAQAISDLGYGVAAQAPDAGATDKAREERSLLISMGVAGFAAANIMLLSVSVWAGQGEMGEATRRTLHMLSGVIALPVLLFSGRHFFRSAWAALRKGHANMDVPISLALSLAFGVSVFETMRGGEHAYFDAVVMLCFFLLIGRFLDARLRRQAHAAANALAAMQASAVTRLTETDDAVSVAASEVSAGDRILLAPGERAMVDMRILSGVSDVDESLVTGESLPRTFSSGMILHAGAINVSAPLRGEALKVAEESLLSRIGEMLEAGEQRRSAYRKIADRAVSIYVPFVHTTAALACIGWLLLGASLPDALMIAAATLIITCPCALALAAPVAQVVAAGRLFRKGVFLRSGDAFERFAEIDHIVFDKTGTLTLGTPKLQGIEVNGQVVPLGSPQAIDLLADAARMARVSHHPLSRALVANAGAGAALEGVREIPGRGLEAEFDGQVWRLGSAGWTGSDVSEAATGPSLWFARGDQPSVQFKFVDNIRPGAVEALDVLRREGIELEIVSGDREGAVGSLAGTLGVREWIAEASPQQKVARLETLRALNHRVLMVGDGLNDAGALSLAHASLAPGAAIDISQSASDAVYSGGLGAIPLILRVAKKTRAIMQQNFALAAAYNVIAVPIAVTGHVTPLVAAIAMSLSSIIVTLNAMRLQIEN
jgi:P-type Cu2+ transporter